MYAVIRAGGKQYRVAPGDVIRVEKLATGTDGQVEFPVVWRSPAKRARSASRSEARVVGEVVEEGRGAKILVFHYKRKKQYKKLRGHRQSYTAVRITEIAFGGQSFKAPELPKKEPKPKKVKAHEDRSAGSARSARKPQRRVRRRRRLLRRRRPRSRQPRRSKRWTDECVRPRI